MIDKHIIRNGQLKKVLEAIRKYWAAQVRYNKLVELSKSGKKVKYWDVLGANSALRTTKNTLQTEVDTFNHLAKRHGFSELPDGITSDALACKFVVLPNFNPDHKY